MYRKHTYHMLMPKFQPFSFDLINSKRNKRSYTMCCMMLLLSRGNVATTMRISKPTKKPLIIMKVETNIVNVCTKNVTHINVLGRCVKISLVLFITHPHTFTDTYTNTRALLIWITPKWSRIFTATTTIHRTTKNIIATMDDNAEKCVLNIKQNAIPKSVVFIAPLPIIKIIIIPKRCHLFFHLSVAIYPIPPWNASIATI